MMKTVVIRITMLACINAMLAPSAAGASWDASVDTESDRWSIERQSETIGFYYSGMVEGDIAPINITPEGRELSSFHTHYLDLDVNDVRLKERTAVKEGKYTAEDNIKLRSETINNVNMTITKPRESDEYKIKWTENWPVTLNASRIINYVGLGINDRDCVGNNLDRIGSFYFYNQEFTKNREANLYLDRMNATVWATNEEISNTYVMPVRTTHYQIESHSSGIADLEYRQTVPHSMQFNYGQERYMGLYDISRKLDMKSIEDENVYETDWLSCCLEGCSGVDPALTGAWNEYEVFGCVCS